MSQLLISNLKLLSFESDYRAKLAKIKLPHTKIKLLQQLRKRALEDFQKVNKIKAVDFTKQFQTLVNKYNERKEDEVLVSNVLDDFAGEIGDLFHALKKEKDGEFAPMFAAWT